MAFRPTGMQQWSSPIIVAAANAPAEARIGAVMACDGTDDDVVIQEVLDTGASVRLVGVSQGGPGLFSLGAPLVVRYPGQMIVGQGMDAVKLLLQDGVDDFAIKTEMPSGETFHWGVQVRDLTIDGNMNNQASGGGIELTRCYFQRVENLRILNTRSYGLRLIGSGGAFGAYGLVGNVTCAVGLGHGIVADALSEFNEFYKCNASYFQGGTPAVNYYDPSPTTAGIGLFLKGGNNVAIGGHYDRCRVGIMLQFSSGNRMLGTGTDNAWDQAVCVEGSHRNVMLLEIGRSDPGSGDNGGAIPSSPAIGHLYGTRRAINFVGDSAANTLLSPVFHPDNSPPASPPAGSADGGWRFHVGESSGAGGAAQGGRNRVLGAIPSDVSIRLDGGSGLIRTKNAAATLTLDEVPPISDGEAVVFADASGGAFTLTLPDLGTVHGDQYRGVVVQNVGGSNNVTVAPFAGDTLAGGNITLTPGQTCKIVGPVSVAATPTTWRKLYQG